MSDTSAQQPVFLLVSAPSAAGKTTLCQRLLARHPELAYSVSCTTRPPREGEVDGEHYNFLSRKRFEELIEEGAFLEYADVYGNYYGTLRSSVEDRMRAGKNVLMDVDVQGAALIRKELSGFGEEHLLSRSFVDVFICPPSLSVLRERIEARGQDSADVIERRMAQAEEEMNARDLYQHVIVNDVLDVAFDELETLYSGFRSRA